MNEWMDCMKFLSFFFHNEKSKNTKQNKTNECVSIEFVFFFINSINVDTHIRN